MIYIGKIENDNLLANENEIIIVGFGQLGKKVYQTLEHMGVKNKIKLICDNSSRFAGMNIEGVPCVTVEEAVYRYPNASFIISNVCVKQVFLQLSNIGAKKIHIVR